MEKTDMEKEMKELFSKIPCIKGKKIVLKRIEESDAEVLAEMVKDPEVYRYLPVFLFEQKYEDIHTVLRKLYDECLEESLFLGVYLNEATDMQAVQDQPGRGSEKERQAETIRQTPARNLCGIAEFYGYRPEMHKMSIGIRLRKQYWGMGLASEAIELMVRYLYEEAGIEIITASVMPENRASESALIKNDFDLVVSSVDEDWGFEQPVKVDKWIR